MATTEMFAEGEHLYSLVEPRDSASWLCPRSRLPACCQRGALAMGTAYSIGRQYFTIEKAKVISLVAVIVAWGCHSASRYYRGSDSCQGLLSTGRFLGDNVWQPDGCMMHNYLSTEAKACLAGKKIVFIGDSQILQLFVSFTNIIMEGSYIPTWKPINVSFRDNSTAAQLDFLWNPWADADVLQHLTALSQASVKPYAVLVGTPPVATKDEEGSVEGLLQYKANVLAMARTLENLTQFGEVYLHIQALQRAQKNITNLEIDLNNKAALEALNIGSSRIKLLDVFHLAAFESTDVLGAMVFMNSLCNKVVRPIDGSCCLVTPPLTFLQKMAFCLFLGSALLFVVLHFVIKRPHRHPVDPDVEGLEKKPATAAGPPGTEAVCGALCRMGLIMLYFYLCDRADVFMKEQKHYSHSAFFIPLIMVFVLGLLCRESTKESRVLNREQTDEWKGWMQLVILIYHFSGASAFIPVYMHVRVLVAAYLFQTGYGHLSFFWLKADFGLYRVCQVLFRLNFLVLLLCVVMDRPYQFYYFVPLVTFWFVLVYSTLAMWPQIVQKKANNSALWHLGVLLKLLGLLLLICILANSQGLFESTFAAWPLSALFELNGSIHEWWFRWKLDRFAVIQGMLFAFIYLLLQKKQVLMEGRGDTLFSAKVSIPLLLLSLLSFITYSVWASHCKSKSQCNEIHPFISAIPILAFIIIRNIPGSARSMYSSFFAWFGKISLELFICQYHIWLAADTRGILVFIPGHPSLNILLSTFIFVCVAHEVSLITNVLAHLLIPKDTVALLKRLGALGVVLMLLLLPHLFKSDSA